MTLTKSLFAYTLRASRKEWRQENDIPPSRAYLNVLIRGADEFHLDYVYLHYLKGIVPEWDGGNDARGCRSKGCSCLDICSRSLHACMCIPRWGDIIILCIVVWYHTSSCSLLFQHCPSASCILFISASMIAAMIFNDQCGCC